MEWTRKVELRGKVQLLQEEGSAMGREKQGKSKGISRKTSKSARRKTEMSRRKGDSAKQTKRINENQNVDKSELVWFSVAPHASAKYPLIIT